MGKTANMLQVAVAAFLVLHTAHGQRFADSEISDIRLVNSDGTTGGNSGRVEVLYNGTWGTICDDGWSYSDARVACRMLGFDGALCYPGGARFGAGSSSSPIWMDDLLCSGNEAALDLCYFTGWGLHNCAHYEDAGVVCSNELAIGIPSDVRLNASTTSTLTIRWTAPKTPDDVSSASYRIRYETEDGSILRTYSYSPPTHSAGAQLTYTLSSLFRDTEYMVQVAMRVRYSACRYSYVYGNYSDPISFRTNATLKQSNIPVRLVSTTPGLNFLGRVEVFYNNIWGTVCDDLFGRTEANVVCQMLNFTRGALCYGSGYTFGRGTGQIWLDNVNCRAGDEVLDDCDFNDWGVHNCGHYDDVGVVCRSNELFPPVENVTVTDVGPTVFTVQWNPYNFSSGFYRSYFQVYYEDSRGYSRVRTVYSASTTQYTLSGLSFGEVYNVSVRVQIRPVSACYFSYLYGEYSNVLTVETIETAPTSAPTDFHVNTINSTAIEVLWELPPYNSRGGIIRGYKLFVIPANGGQERTINIRDNTTDVYVVGGLSVATSYRFSVLAYTSVGDGPRSIALTLATLRFDPLITEFGLNGNGLDKATLYVSSYRYGRVNIHCTSSNATHAPADWYFANGTRIGVRNRNFRAGHFANGTAMLQIAHYRTLSFCDGGNYTCIINASSGHYETRNFTLVINTTPPSPGQPFLVKAQSTSITIGWSETACDGGHPLLSFNLQYDKVYGYFPSRTIRNIDPTRRNYTITGLTSNTYYRFKVQAVSVNSRTSFYSSTVSIYTLAPAPTAPRDVTVRLVSPRVAEVSWRVPAVPNGVITRYTVYATPLGAARQRRQAVAVTTPQTIQAVFPGTARAGNITLTDHSITYQFRVSAGVVNGQTLNEGALSIITASTNLFVPEPGLPTPLNVQVARSTNSSLTLSWDYPPPPSEAIQNFLVSYSANVQYRSPLGVLILFEDSGEVTATINRITIGALVPESDYQFRVSAVTDSGRGAEASASGRTRLAYDNSLAYFQVRIGPIQNCIEFMDLTEESSKDNLINVRSGLAQELDHLCPTCGFTVANIKDDEFSCRGGLTKQIVYRARIMGTDVYSATGLVSLMQSWVGSGRASIMVQSSRLHLDSTCSASLDTLKAPDCQGGEEKPTTSVPTTPSEPTKPTVSPSAAAASGSSVGEIGGVAVGAVIIVLLAILIVLVVVVMMRKWRAKLSISNDHTRMKEPDYFAESPFADVGSNRSSAAYDDVDNKDDLKKTSTAGL